MRSSDVLIVGAGHAGVQAVVSLTTGGFQGTISVISDEPAAPYERPPLTKGYLTGAVLPHDLGFRTEGWWAGSGIDRLLGSAVVAVDSVAHTVTLDNGGVVRYGTLIWAAGAQARTLPVPGAELEGVLFMRRLRDAEMIKRRVVEARKAVIVGGGFIGLEVAASLRALEVDTTVVEIQERLMARVTGEEVSRYMRARHEQEGVKVLLEEGVAAILGDDGRAVGVKLTSGRTLDADLVIVGVGIEPNVEPLAAAGALIEDGVAVDAYCRTTLPDVYAIGDCTRFESPYGSPSGRLRLESVQNAHDQAKVVASAVLGTFREYEAVPWFWTHQYDDKLQTAGVVADYDSTVVRGTPDCGAFSVVYLRDDVIVAVDAVNVTRDFAQAKRLIGRRLVSDRSRVSDIAIPLKACVVDAT